MAVHSTCLDINESFEVVCYNVFRGHFDRQSVNQVCIAFSSSLDLLVALPSQVTVSPFSSSSSQTRLLPLYLDTFTSVN